MPSNKNNVNNQTELQNQEYYNNLISNPVELILKVDKSNPYLTKKVDLEGKLKSIPGRFATDKPFKEHYIPRLENLKATVEILKDMNAFDMEKIDFISTVKYKLLEAIQNDENFTLNHPTITPESLNTHLDEALKKTRENYSDRTRQIPVLEKYVNQLDSVCSDEKFLVLWDHESGANILDQSFAIQRYNELHTSLAHQYTPPAYTLAHSGNPLPNYHPPRYNPLTRGNGFESQITPPPPTFNPNRPISSDPVRSTRLPTLDSHKRHNGPI